MKLWIVYSRSVIFHPLSFVCKLYQLSTVNRWKSNSNYTDEKRIFFCSFNTPQAFWQSSALGAFSTLVTSVVLYSLTRATLMSRRKDETRVYGYMRSEFIHWALWRTLMRTEYFCSFTTPQAFWQSSAPGALSTLVTSVVLYSLTRATLMSRGKNETLVCGNISIYVEIWDENKQQIY